MSLFEILAWFAAAYLAGGVLTVAAVAVLGRGQPAPTTTPRATIRFWLKLFVLWPGVVMMGTVFAVLMLLQQRQSRPPRTLIERVVWATEFLTVIVVSAVTLPFCMAPALGRWCLRRTRADKKRDESPAGQNS